MKNCVKCNGELRTSFDEFGKDYRQPLCWNCWQAEQNGGKIQLPLPDPTKPKQLELGDVSTLVDTDGKK